MSREVDKIQDSLCKLGRRKDELEREMTPLEDRLRALRLAAIRAGSDLGELPFIPGLDPSWRETQLRKETIARENREKDEETRRDPHTRALFGNAA